jgi:hypothetical protein
MIKVFTKTFASPAYSTIRTMVDFLFTVVVPQLAYVAIVARSFCLAIAAIISCLLRCSTYHTKHVLGTLPIQVVVFRCVMAVPTGIPMLALKTLHFDIALVVLAAESKPRFRRFVLFILTMICAAMLGLWPIRGVRVTRSQTIWVLGINVRCGRYGRGNLCV